MQSRRDVGIVDRYTDSLKDAVRLQDHGVSCWSLFSDRLRKIDKTKGASHSFVRLGKRLPGMSVVVRGVWCTVSYFRVG